MLLFMSYEKALGSPPIYPSLEVSGRYYSDRPFFACYVGSFIVKRIVRTGERLIRVGKFNLCYPQGLRDPR